MKKCTLGVFLDLAFDTIDHNILLKKLKWYDVRGVALDWFRNYLTNRKQYLQFVDSKSSVQHIQCGVKQGSVLGPLLFIIYTHDLSKCLSLSKAIIFADDTTIYLSSNYIIYLYQSINTELQSLTEWLRANKLSLNVGITNFVLFSHKCASISVPCHLRIKIGNDEIERKSTVIFLGMHIYSKLEWHEYIKFIQNKLSSGLYAMNNALSTC